MVSYKYYTDNDFDTSDGAVIIDLDADIDGTRHDALIECIKGELLVELEFSTAEGFGDQITLQNSDKRGWTKITRIRLNASVNNTFYKITGGLTLDSAVSGRNRNARDTATQSAVTLNATTSITIQALNATRIYFRVDNTSAISDVFIKLQAASVDNVKVGIFVVKKGGFWEMPIDNIYIEEISAIADNDTPVIMVTEY